MNIQWWKSMSRVYDDQNTNNGDWYTSWINIKMHGIKANLNNFI